MSIPALVVLAAVATLAATSLAAPASARERAPSAPQANPCPISQVTQTLRTNRPQYFLGAPVKVTLNAKNNAGRTCAPPGLVHVDILDASGRRLAGTEVSFRWLPSKRWKSGQSMRYSFTWEQNDCAGDVCAPARPGSYRAVGGWDEFRPASTSFTLVGQK